MYEADQQDILGLGGFPPAERDRMRQQHAGEYHAHALLTTSYVAFDASRPPFDDPRVRRAFVLATDRETLADVTGQGYDLAATGGFVPPGMPGHAAGIALPYDPEGAKRVLAEAGYPGGQGFPALKARTFSLHRFLCEDLQAQWRENLGVEVALESMDFSAFVDSLEEDPPLIYFSGWGADYPDPDSFLRVAVDTIRRSTFWKNEAFDALVEKARRVTDQGARMELYRQAEKILIEEAPIMALSYWRQHALLKPWVKLPVSPLGNWLMKDCVIEPH
jgi:ABC-type transport system substrate-binding protein